ncbi:unnamed protein product [Phytophthora lilii]|uniref:Unnamed protein product n=1 Tax=Phytophthora lilii TaxID=2077276 RepID=A0A9W6U2I9_9STRA|nr:unnamed protein product [Phytophthora lilii]
MDINNVSPIFGTVTNHLFRMMTNNSQKLIINSGGSVSIGNNNNTYKLDVAGTSITDILRIRTTGSCPDFIIDAYDGVGGNNSGLRIYAASQNILTYSNMGFYNPAKTIQIAGISTYNQNCFHTRPQSGADTNASMPNVGFCSGNNAIVRQALMITANTLTNSSNYTPTAKLTICADTNFSDGSYNKALRITNSNFVNEFLIEITDANKFPTWLENVSNTDLRFGVNNSTAMILTTAGRLGVGTTSPVAPLHVSGVANYTITNIATNTYIYNVSNNTWANLGGGPVTISIAAFFVDDIYVQNSVYTSSDRRSKENIKDIDLDIERYKLLKPSSYNYKNQLDKTKIGLIGQDVAKVCGEALIFNENANMKVEEEGDIEGLQLGMDYNAITVLNVAVIKQLISRIENLNQV